MDQDRSTPSPCRLTPTLTELRGDFYMRHEGSLPGDLTMRHHAGRRTTRLTVCTRTWGGPVARYLAGVVRKWGEVIQSG